MIKKAYAAGAVLAAIALAGCGSSSQPTAPVQAQELKSPPATVPGDYTSVAAITRQLQGVATCTSVGPTSELCTLVTSGMNTAQIATIRPFQVKVFKTPADTKDYLSYVHGTNVTRANNGSEVRQALTGPHWVVTSPGEAVGLAGRLKPYLGGTIFQ